MYLYTLIYNKFLKVAFETKRVYILNCNKHCQNFHQTCCLFIFPPRVYKTSIHSCHYYYLCKSPKKEMEYDFLTSTFNYEKLNIYIFYVYWPFYKLPINALYVSCLESSTQFNVYSFFTIWKSSTYVQIHQSSLWILHFTSCLEKPSSFQYNKNIHPCFLYFYGYFCLFYCFIIQNLLW